ncbi:Endo-1,4-beta-xylanase C [Anabarilius grahami]|uniref:Endo-1,4-beta-xylanase C n=1 Tax=Anabarilius grahami TaxID=495550 RepID=A0A3N0YMP1_ANAGA|nr:Endo-1,4-beta-xylanase C [Anabarilius grahami]
MLSDNRSINQPNQSQANAEESLRLFSMDSPHFIKEEGKEHGVIYQLCRAHGVASRRRWNNRGGGVGTLETFTQVQGEERTGTEVFRSDLGVRAAMAGQRPWVATAGQEPQQAMAGLDPWTAMAGQRPWAAMEGLEPWQAMEGLEPWQAMEGLEPWQAMEGLGLEPWQAMEGLEPWQAMEGLEPWQTRWQLERARGSLERARGSLERARGRLERVCGRLEQARGNLERVTLEDSSANSSTYLSSGWPSC